MLNLLVVVGLVALVIWLGLSLLKETDFYDEVVDAMGAELVYWASWILALLAIGALSGVLYIALT